MGVAAVSQARRHAEADYGDPAVPPNCSAEGCEECEDQEERLIDQVQGALQSLLVHADHARQGQGGEAEAVFATLAPEEGDMSFRSLQVGARNLMARRVECGPSGRKK